MEPDQELVLRISGPLLSYLGTIVAFRGRGTRMLELELVCWLPSLQLALARLVIVLGYDVGLGFALGLLLWAGAGPDALLAHASAPGHGAGPAALLAPFHRDSGQRGLWELARFRRNQRCPPLPDASAHACPACAAWRRRPGRAFHCVATYACQHAPPAPAILKFTNLSD